MKNIFAFIAASLFMIPVSSNAAVVAGRELVIRDLRVVEDPVRTTGCGAWTFCRMMSQLAGTQDVHQFTLAWLQTWLSDRTSNGITIAKRPNMQRIIDAWPKLSSGELSLQRSPFRLLAIVNRIDLRNSDSGDSGEGRFVFGLVDAKGNPLQMTVIFEFKLLNSLQSLNRWANDFHALGSSSLRMGSSYNVALQKLTDRFVMAKIASRPNGSAIGQVRTNEIALANPWELREFVISSSSKQLVMTTVKRTPASIFNGSADLATYINANQSSILSETHTIRAPLFSARASRSDNTVWDAPGIRSSEARHKFALNTCNGCHQSETSTRFLHIAPRRLGEVAALSPFFTNTAVRDGKGVLRTFNELSRRRQNFDALLATQTSPAQIMSETGVSAAEQLAATNSPSGLAH